MKLFQYVPLCLLAGLLACQKPSDVVKPGDPSRPADSTTTTAPPSPGERVVYDHGTPTGQPIQKVIGPEGGTLASSDGTLKMTIPAGAIAKATTFSIQPVTGTLPGLLGNQSFRLLPEGQTFAQPVTLQYHYNADSLDGTSAEVLFMAYQGSDGCWKALVNTDLNEATQTLTVTTKHFSDWGAFAEFILDATPDNILPGQTSQLELKSFYDDLIVPLVLSDYEALLSRRRTLQDNSNIRNWTLKGKGGLDVAASRLKATYSAPAAPAQGSALVTVDVYNFLPANRKGPEREGGPGKAELLKTIRYGGTYFRATVDGQSYNCSDYFGNVGSSGTAISGGFNGDHVIFLHIPTSNPQPGTISYSTRAGADGKADVNFADGLGGYNYVSYYDTCDGDDLLPSAGNVTIDAIETINGERYARGSFSCTTYYITGNCPGRDVRTKKITAEFRVLLGHE